MKDKVTIKDIAREAGVSVATVSYILNNKTNQKISDDVKKKVLQIVNIFGYSINPYARNLATGKSGNIALYTGSDFHTLQKAEQHNFIESFTKTLYSNKYNLFYLNSDRIESLNFADAIICLNTSREFFYKVGSSNFIPLIAVNSLINDPLFFQINNDYQHIFQTASTYFNGGDFLLLVPENDNIELKERIKLIFPKTYFLESIDDTIAKLSKSKDKNLVVLNSSILEISKPYNKNIFYYQTPTDSMLEKIVECIDLTIKRVPIDLHDIKVI